jgi:hypothetical protein
MAKFAPISKTFVSSAGAGLAGGRNLSASLKYTQQFSQIFALNNMQSPNGNIAGSRHTVGQGRQCTRCAMAILAEWKAYWPYNGS